jgi:hypothetical protein
MREKDALFARKEPVAVASDLQEEIRKNESLSPIWGERDSPLYNVQNYGRIPVGISL